MSVAALRAARQRHFLARRCFKSVLFWNKSIQFTPPSIKNSEFRLEFAVFLINLAATEITLKLLRI